MGVPILSVPSSKHSGGSHKKTGITDHWIVGSLSAADATFTTGSRQASAHYGVGQGEIHQYYPDAVYGWHAGNSHANAHTIGIEHEGGPNLPITEAVIRNSAELHAMLADRHDLGTLQIGVNVFPHSRWFATACPGTLSIVDVVARANALLGSGQTSAIPNVSAIDYNPNGYDRKYVARVQSLLNQHGAQLVVDGWLGQLTYEATLAFQRAHGLLADGIPGPKTMEALMTMPNRRYKRIDVDSRWGSDTTGGFQTINGRKVDNVISSQDSAWRDHFPELTTGWEWVDSSEAAGSQVLMTIQSALKKAGCYDGTIDGLWGPKTAAGFIQYFKANTLAEAIAAAQAAINTMNGW